MLLAAFKALWIQLVVFTAILVTCATIAWIASGPQAAVALLDTAVVQMKGPWVWTFGFGLAMFVRRWGPKLPTAVDGILVPNEITAATMTQIEQSTHHRNAWLYTLPITLLGIFLTAVYGIPNTGVAKYLIFVGVCLIYYVGALVLFHFIEVIRAFHVLLENMNHIEFRQIYSPLHLENLTTYLALTTWIGLVGIYAGFRGTLTAAFHFRQEIWRTFLTTPLILFLPGTLFYNYYPRYVLRKILQHRVFKTMEKLGTADETKVKSLILDLKESALLDSQILPFLDYKSLPSYLIAAFFILSLAYNYDPVIKDFVQ
jgi:hypothetical protein